MLLGLSLSAFTTLHVVISLIGIVTGLIVLAGFLVSKDIGLWTALFLIFTVLTSLTGFLFPVQHFMPSHAVGILSLIALALAVAARYRFHSVGAWRKVFVICSTIALYFNVFVLVVQLFRHVPALKAAAPTQSEPPFVVAQIIVMAAFIVLGIFAVKRFHPNQLAG